jgi:hypothetical protein
MNVALQRLLFNSLKIGLYTLREGVWGVLGVPAFDIAGVTGEEESALRGERGLRGGTGMAY